MRFFKNVATLFKKNFWVFNNVSTKNNFKIRGRYVATSCIIVVTNKKELRLYG